MYVDLSALEYLFVDWFAKLKRQVEECLRNFGG